MHFFPFFLWRENNKCYICKRKYNLTLSINRNKHIHSKTAVNETKPLGKQSVMAKFINPFTDIGFKRIFGQDISKPLLIDFLNCLLEREHKIVDLTFLDKEQVASSADDRSLIYDVYCKADNDERFIVEMQNKRQDFFIDRSIYYLSSSIARQGERGGEWRYELTPVYLIAFLNFKLAALRPTLRTDAVLTDTATGNALPKG